MFSFVSWQDWTWQDRTTGASGPLGCMKRVWAMEWAMALASRTTTNPMLSFVSWTTTNPMFSFVSWQDLTWQALCMAERGGMQMLCLEVSSCCCLFFSKFFWEWKASSLDSGPFCSSVADWHNGLHHLWALLLEPF